ncbi:MAG: phospho-sugar mutase, partial [Bacteroidota bacterium]|nr:phospho-sugar mutase [Bacteroidota bacterium]
VAIAYDSRNNSKLFAESTANIISANGIKVFLFDSLRPTPELSFTIRHLGCNSGIVITASHNPKEYNGYKVYWNDGAQLINPHDENVISEVRKITNINEVKFGPIKENITIIGKEIDDIYLSKIKELSLSPETIKLQKDIKIVYTPLHGTGVNLVPQSLRNFGFENVQTVKSQNISDGNFPTVKSPNPEEPAALTLAIEKAKETNADLVLATDPDADRVGIAIKDNKNEYILLNGNQTGAILINYLLKKWKENGKIKGNEYIVKTIVTSYLIDEIALKNGVECYNVLTGFKFIADVIGKNEGIKTYIGGGEESYGYLVGDFVRDKDAVSACCMIAEAAAYWKNKGISLYDNLLDIYLEFGIYKDYLLSLTKKGKEGVEEINQMMEKYRKNPPLLINNSEVIKINDYKLQIEKDLISGQTKPINLPKSNVLQFFLSDGSKITIRPSGTEPKIKFYFNVKGILSEKSKFEQVNDELSQKIQKIINELNLN